MKIKRTLLSLFFSLLMILGLSAPLFATTVDTPTTFSIDAVYVYHNVYTTSDQLYLIEYDVDYTGAYPADFPTTTAESAILTRLVSSTGTLLGSGTINPYFQKGYSKGVVAIYFPPEAIPTWEGTQVAKLDGNPTITWNPTTPSFTYSTFDLWSTSTTKAATSVELGNRILVLAQILENDWSIDLVTSTADATILTSYGTDYFATVIPYVRQTCPQIFNEGLYPALPGDKTPKGTGLADLLNPSGKGGIFDLSPLNGIIDDNLNGEMILGALYTAFIIFCVYMASKVPNSFRIVFPLAGFLVLIGGALGAYPLALSIGFAVLCGIITFFLLTYNKASV